jgi:hypothetical protein
MTQHMSARRAPQVAIVHNDYQRVKSGPPYPSVVPHVYGSTDTSCVAWTLSHCTPVKNGGVIVGWVPVFWEVWGKLIGGDLDVDDEGSEQHRFEPVQSLHHGSIGYQPMRTRIGLTKKAMPLQVNREHKQEQERTISICRWMISSQKLGSYKLNASETILDRLI